MRWNIAQRRFLVCTWKCKYTCELSCCHCISFSRCLYHRHIFRACFVICGDKLNICCWCWCRQSSAAMSELQEGILQEVPLWATACWGKQTLFVLHVYMWWGLLASLYDIFRLTKRSSLLVQNCNTEHFVMKCATVCQKRLALELVTCKPSINGVISCFEA